MMPEQNHEIVTAGYCKDTCTALTARSSDGKLAIIYFPSTGTTSREFTIDTAAFAGSVLARWCNPVSGSFRDNKASGLPSHGQRRLRTPGDNGSEANDWLLVLQVL